MSTITAGTWYPPSFGTGGFLHEGQLFINPPFCTMSTDTITADDLALHEPPAEGEVSDLSQLSDGYHTFAELYEHRHALMLAFMRATPDFCWFSRRHADGGLPFGTDEWFIVGAELPDSGTVTYHLPMRLWGLAEMTGAAELELGRPWDGHTAKDVVQRLTEWATNATLQGPAMTTSNGVEVGP